MFNMPPAAPQRRFLELTIAGQGKKLYMPSDSVLTYEEVAEGKNPHFPDAGSFLRYDYGEGLAFALVTDLMPLLREEVGIDGFLDLHLIDEASILIRKDLVVALQEKEDDGVEATQISLTLGGQIGSLYVKDSFEEIKSQQQ